MSFPNVRLRRLRRRPALRRLVQETALAPDDLVLPLFVVPGENVREPIGALEGHYHLSADEAERVAAEAHEAGVGGVILFGLPARKDPLGDEAADPQGPVQETIRRLRRSLPELVVMTDVCLCQYTTHGHCGHVDSDTGEVLNDSSLGALARMALSHAEAGADIVAPSDMMDGRVGAIRRALDEAGFSNVAILSYAAKYASAFYGPFREAADSAPQHGDRRSYQMAPPNRREALREVALDVEEGADIVMVKPAMPYLDIVADVRAHFDLPLAAYQVSGEYAMIQAAAARGWLDRQAAMFESLTAIRRAGADFILTYFATEAARLLQRGSWTY